jgi:galactose mutarotase-like enzyme
MHIRSGDTVAELAPERGGMVTRLRVGAREVLYLDEATLADRAKNVRGGIPVLFPSPGKLGPGRYAMKQHGFARDLAWQIVDAGEAHARLALDSSTHTRALFPFDFHVELTYRVSASSLRIEQRVENRGREPLPFAFGFHPYFFVPDGDKARATISTRATRAFDNVTKREIAFAGFDLTAPEVDLHLVDHGSGRAVLERPGARVTVEASPEYGRWVVWTLAGKDFVCVEPWTAPADALHSGEQLLHVAPDGAHTLWMTLSSE